MLLTPSLKLLIFPVQKWIKKAGQKAERKFFRKLLTLKKQGKVKAISIDEAWSFAGKKENEVWIWSVIVEYEDGRTEKLKYYQGIGHIVRRKKGRRVNRNKSLYSKLRSYLACLKRKTKAFSRTLEALERNLYFFSIYHLFE